MKYRDLLKLYAAGELTQEQRMQIESEVEKQEAISEYLYDQEDDFLEISGGDEEEVGSPEGHALTHTIQKSIRRVFLRMALISAILVLAGVVLSMSILPKVVDRFYYDPRVLVENEEHSGDVEGNYYFTESVFQLGMRCYSELFLPMKSVDSAFIEPKGYGTYQFVLSSSYYRKQDPQLIHAGKIQRENIEFYYPAALKRPADNAFEWTINMPQMHRKLSEQIPPPQADVDEDGNEVIVFSAAGMGRYKENAKDFLQEETSDQRLLAYITFDKIHSYEEAKSFASKYGLEHVWYGVVTDSQKSHVIGMYGQVGVVGMNELKKYPYIYGYERSKDEEPFLSMESEENAKQHFLSMMRFLRDQKKFSEMMKIEEVHHVNFDKSIEYVEEHGIKIYGIAVVSTAEELLEILNDHAVYSMGTELH